MNRPPKDIEVADALMGIFGLKRSWPKRRRSGPPRRGPVEIPADEWRNPEYRAFLREEGWCVVCQLYFGGHVPAGDCDPAHTVNAKTSQKGPDSTCAPLCRRHHDEYDGQVPLPNRANGKPRERNHAAFEKFYCVDMKAEAARWWEAFKNHECPSRRTIRLP